MALTVHRTVIHFHGGASLTLYIREPLASHNSLKNPSFIAVALTGGGILHNKRSAEILKNLVNSVKNAAM